MNKPVVEPDGMRAYLVRFTEPGGDRHHVITGFSTQQLAAAWLDEYQRAGKGLEPGGACVSKIASSASS